MLDISVDSNKLKHRPEVIKTLFVNKGDTVVAGDDFEVVFPERYINKGLAIPGSVIEVVCIFAVVNDKGEYGTVLAPVMTKIVPSNVRSILIDGVATKALTINKGDVFIPNRTSVQSAIFMYDLMDEFFMQGKVPWFLSYDNLANMFLEASKYAGSGVGNDPLAMELITSLITRSPTDKLVSYRSVIKSPTDKLKPAYVGMTNVYYSYDNTLSKIMGGYMRAGITTAIVNKEKKTTKVSAILRA